MVFLPPLVPRYSSCQYALIERLLLRERHLPIVSPLLGLNDHEGLVGLSLSLGDVMRSQVLLGYAARVLCNASPTHPGTHRDITVPFRLLGCWRSVTVTDLSVHPIHPGTRVFRTLAVGSKSQTALVGSLASFPIAPPRHRNSRATAAESFRLRTSYPYSYLYV